MAAKRYSPLLTLAELEATLYALDHFRVFGGFPVAQRRARDAVAKMVTFAKLDRHHPPRKPHTVGNVHDESTHKLNREVNGQ